MKLLASACLVAVAASGQPVMLPLPTTNLPGILNEEDGPATFPASGVWNKPGTNVQWTWFSCNNDATNFSVRLLPTITNCPFPATWTTNRVTVTFSNATGTASTSLVQVPIAIPWGRYYGGPTPNGPWQPFDAGPQILTAPARYARISNWTEIKWR